MSARDVLIVGAGPSGLATAIACRHHGLDYQVLEQGARAEHVFILVEGQLNMSRSVLINGMRLPKGLGSGGGDVALAGGVSRMITPGLSVFMDRIGAISPTGRWRLSVSASIRIATPPGP